MNVNHRTFRSNKAKSASLLYNNLTCSSSNNTDFLAFVHQNDVQIISKIPFVDSERNKTNNSVSDMTLTVNGIKKQRNKKGNVDVNGNVKGKGSSSGSGSGSSSSSNSSSIETDSNICDFVLQAKFCQFEEETRTTCLVVTTCSFVNIFKMPRKMEDMSLEEAFRNRNKTVISYNLRNCLKDCNETLQDIFFRGIAHCSKGRSRLMIGSSLGDVFIFFLKGIKLQNPIRKREHDFAISCMASTENGGFVSGDCGGNIIAWSGNRPSMITPKCIFRNIDEQACTSIVTHRDSIFAAYSTGHIREFRQSTQAMIVEIVAHARCILALDFDPSSLWLASVGEDTILNVFKIPSEKEEEEEIKLIKSIKAEDSVLTGIQFAAEDSHVLLGTAYDKDTIHIWQIKNK